MNTTFTTGEKFEIKNIYNCSIIRFYTLEFKGTNPRFYYR